MWQEWDSVFAAAHPVPAFELLAQLRIRLLNDVDSRVRLLAFPAPPSACTPGTAEISQFLCGGLPDVHRVSGGAGSEHDWRITPLLRIAFCLA